MHASVSTSDYIAPMGDVLEVPDPIARKLLAMRMTDPRSGEAVGPPICGVVSDPRLMAKAKKIHLCQTAPVWGEDEEDE